MVASETLGAPGDLAEVDGLVAAGFEELLHHRDDGVAPEPVWGFQLIRTDFVLALLGRTVVE